MEAWEVLDAMADMMDLREVERESRDNLANPLGDSTCGLMRALRVRLVCGTAEGKTQ